MHWKLEEKPHPNDNGLEYLFCGIRVQQSDLTHEDPKVTQQMLLIIWTCFAPFVML